MKIRWEKDIRRWCIYNHEGDYIGSITKESTNRWCANVNGRAIYADNFHDARWYAYNA